MKKLITEFCPALEEEDPIRIVKLLEILETKEALRFVLILPANTFSPIHFSEHSSVKPFMIDFINDARTFAKMNDREITDALLRVE